MELNDVFFSRDPDLEVKFSLGELKKNTHMCESAFSELFRKFLSDGYSDIKEVKESILNFNFKRRSFSAKDIVKNREDKNFNIFKKECAR